LHTGVGGSVFFLGLGFSVILKGCWFSVFPYCGGLDEVDPAFRFYLMGAFFDCLGFEVGILESDGFLSFGFFLHLWGGSWLVFVLPHFFPIFSSLSFFPRLRFYSPFDLNKFISRPALSARSSFGRLFFLYGFSCPPSWSLCLDKCTADCIGV